MKLQLVAKYQNSKKFKIEIFEQCHNAEKCNRGDPLRFFDIHCVAKNKRNEGGPFGGIQKALKKSHSAQKNPSGKHQRGILSYRGSGRRCFWFRRGLAFRVCFGGP